jgi:Protein of unknown function (DUF1236)
MKNLRYALMGSIAALAVATAGGATLAQDSQQHNGLQGKQPPAAMQPNKGQMGGAQAQPNRTMGQGAGEEKSNRNAQTEPNRAVQPDRKVGQSGNDEKQGAKDSAQRRDDMSRDSRQDKTDAKTNVRTDKTTAQGQDRSNLKGLQGNASGVSLRLSDQQKTQIRTTVIEARNAPRADHVNFDIAVGTAVPRGGVRIVPIPATLVQIEPTWRGFEYFVYEQEIVIVNPRDMTIVAVLVV